MARLLVLFFCIVTPIVLNSQEYRPQILSVEEQSRVIDEVLEDRLDNLLPELMRREGLDMWILISREYNDCLLYTSPSPRDRTRSRMPSSA